MSNARTTEEIPQVDISMTSFELESITSSYKGLMLINRLLYIVQRCPALRNEALLAMAKHLQETHFSSLFKQVVEEMKKHNVPFPPEFDVNWNEKAQRSFCQKLEKLDNDLKNFRTNSIKDSIRRGHEDLGDHYFDAGDFFNAVRCYVRARDYCVLPRHVVNMCLNVIKASLFMQNWPNVLSYVSKAQQTLEFAEKPNQNSVVPMISTLDETSKQNFAQNDVVIFARLKVYAGITELVEKRYKIAARYFLQVPFEFCSNFFQDLISPQTLIQYVCLCTLATFDRSELHRSVIMSNNMKQYLELEPAILDILQKFYDTSYSACLGALVQYRPIFALDQYIGEHLPALYKEIRLRTIIMYFTPYKNASMTIMAKQLNTTLEALEDELVHLIRSGKIQARIDSQKKILYAADTDQRWSAYQNALTATKRTEYLSRFLVLRTAILRANLSVRDETMATGGLMRTTSGGPSRRQIPSNIREHMLDVDDEEEFFDDGPMG